MSYESSIVSDGEKYCTVFRCLFPDDSYNQILDLNTDDISTSRINKIEETDRDMLF